MLTEALLNSNGGLTKLILNLPLIKRVKNNKNRNNILHSLSTYLVLDMLPQCHPSLIYAPNSPSRSVKVAIPILQMGIEINSVAHGCIAKNQNLTKCLYDKRH